VFEVKKEIPANVLDRKLGLVILLIVVLGLPASAQNRAVDDEGHQWWQHAVFYEIYPRSFADSNNDGIGDIPGITSKLDYMHWLGVDATWIAPMFPSPHVDWGYDISDYYNVDPDYGTLKDLDELVAQSKQRKMRVLLDLVLITPPIRTSGFRRRSPRPPTPRGTGISGATAKAHSSPQTIGRRILEVRRGSLTLRRASDITTISIRHNRI